MADTVRTFEMKQSSDGLMPDLAERVSNLADRVALVIPARPEMFFMIRMTAAGVASRLDFGYDQVEDLRLALDELCLTLLTMNPGGGNLELEFSWSDDAIDVTAAVTKCGSGFPRPAREPAQPAASDAFSTRIIEAITDDHGLGGTNGSSRSWLRMFRRERFGDGD